MFAEADLDRDNYISLSEFLFWYFKDNFKENGQETNMNAKTFFKGLEAADERVRKMHELEVREQGPLGNIANREALAGL